MFGFSNKILKRYLQRSDKVPQINPINYLKTYCNIINNRNNPYYSSNIFIKSGLSEYIMNLVHIRNRKSLMIHLII